MHGRGGWSGGAAGGRQGVLTPLFPHRRAFPTTERIRPGTWVSLLLSFDRGPPVQIGASEKEDWICFWGDLFVFLVCFLFFVGNPRAQCKTGLEPGVFVGPSEPYGSVGGMHLGSADI